MAARGWEPISANFLLPKWVASHWPKYVEGCEQGNRPADPANWRIAKSIFVAEDDATARNYATDPNGPYVTYYNSLLTKMRRGGRLNLFKADQDMHDDAVTLEDVCSQLIFCGSPERVTDQILEFRETVGDFGQLVYAGHDWADAELGKNSMILMAEKVLPAVNQVLISY